MESPLGISFEDTGTQSCFNANVNLKSLPPKSGLKDQRSGSYKIKRTRNFDKMYLKFGLWPGKVPLEVRQEYYKCQLKVFNMKLERDKENACEKCRKFKNQLDSTKLALQHALDLGTTLIKQISSNSVID